MKTTATDLPFLTTVSSPNVFCVRHPFEMGWVAAGAVSAQMIYDKCVWGWSFAQDLCDSMGCKSVLLSFDPYLGGSVSSACEGSAPWPAFVI